MVKAGALMSLLLFVVSLSGCMTTYHLVERWFGEDEPGADHRAETEVAGGLAEGIAAGSVGSALERPPVAP